jgi:hypothetical protein
VLACGVLAYRRVGVSACRRVGVADACYPEGVTELSPGVEALRNPGLGWFLCDLPCRGNRFDAQVLRRIVIELG